MTSRIPQVEQRVASRIQRVERAGAAVYWKEHTTDDWEHNGATIDARAEREATTILRLAELPTLGKRLGVVRLVEKTPGRPVLATAEVPGRPLDFALHAYCRSHNTLGAQRAIFLTGRWLRAFQSMPILPGDLVRVGEKSPEDLLEYCGLRLRDLEVRNRGGMSRRFSTQVLESVKRLLQARSPEDRSKVWCHCDYTFCNVLWDGHTVTPIDFAMARPDVPLLDVTYFIHRMEMQRVYRPWLRWPIGTWRRAFLRGYGRPDAEESPMYRALMIRHLICRLHTYVRRPPRDVKQALHDRWVRTYLRWRLAHEVRGARE